MIVAGTGHRPDKLGGYGEEASLRLISVAKDWLERAYWQHEELEVISGMALGWDQALAHAACQLNIPWTAAIPFEGQQKRWPQESQRIYDLTLLMASKVVYVCDPGYAPWKMQKRNEWMMDNCTHVLAMYNGTPGGTANCIKYAEKLGRPIINLYDMWKASNA